MVTPVAQADLRRLGQFLVAKSPRAARRAVNLIEEALISLQEMPDRTPIREDGIRELMVRFGAGGYVARYRVMADHVIVLRIFHMREDR
nr:type II toxin-antitoxin system RelE/ParE family toxin [Brevundimonas sp.]